MSFEPGGSRGQDVASFTTDVLLSLKRWRDPFLSLFGISPGGIGLYNVSRTCVTCDNTVPFLDAFNKACTSSFCRRRLCPSWTSWIWWDGRRRWRGCSALIFQRAFKRVPVSRRGRHAPVRPRLVY